MDRIPLKPNFLNKKIIPNWFKRLFTLIKLKKRCKELGYKIISKKKTANGIDIEIIIK
jgi:hypothetical protein